MLPRWHSVATLALAPEGIACRYRGQLVQWPAAEAAGWPQRLADLAGQPALAGVKRVRFVLSSRYARYAVLPWQAGISARQDWQALAERLLHQLYGAKAGQWESRVALQGYRAPAVVCAIESELAGGLRACAGQAGWAVEGIEPALMAVFNRHLKQLAGNTDMLLLAEPQRLLLAQFESGQWRHVAVAAPPAGSEGDEATAMVERALALHPAGRGATVALFGAPGHLPPALPAGCRPLRLPTSVPTPAAGSLALLAEI